MKNKILLVIVVFLTVVLIVQPKNVQQKKIVKQSKTVNKENKLLEDYVLKVVAAEMPASFSLEALKAQAIAARTYTVYKVENNVYTYNDLDNCTDQAHIDIDQMKEKWQNDFSKYYKKIEDAVESTKGEIMTYDGNVIEAYYFAMSNGYTEDSITVFNEDLPYIQSVSSSWDNPSINKFEVTVAFTKQEFCTKLNIDCNNLIVSNQILDDTGRTKEININNIKFTGIDIRKKLSLRSTDFKIEILNDKVNVTTKGYGHGVGLSQYGANGMAKEGYDCYEILNHYYKDIKIKKN